jgi:hydroxymethylglutaryl-CoA reductase (NADPH)
MNSEELIEKLLKGEIKVRKIDEYTKDSNEATRIRREFLEKKFGVKLEHIAKTTIDFNDALSRNIENPIGATQVPLGFAGELKINGDYANGTYPILLATTEGRLVAGMARGIKVVNLAGGVSTTVIREGMTRAPVLKTKSAKDSKKLMEWIHSEKAFEFFREEFLKSTKYAKLKEVKAYTTGRFVHVRFCSSTGAAMGMNMITIASRSAIDAMIPKVKEELGIDVVLLSTTGNLCTDKKPAHIDMLEGRGTSVIAEVTIPEKIVIENFRVKPEQVAELCRVKCLQGSALAGSHGFNAHVANILAAMYIAHGQDPAQIVEGSQAITDASVVNGDLYVSCYLPAIEVGTYGGGTKRETQQEALRLLGLYGEGDEEGKTRLAFAEVVAAACLASELNLIAIEAAHELSVTHAKLKRG